MKLCVTFIFATLASSQITLNSSLPCDQLENLNLIENVRPICTKRTKRNKFRCQLQCENSNQTAWPLKKIDCKVRNAPGSWRYKPEEGEE